MGKSKKKFSPKAKLERLEKLNEANRRKYSPEFMSQARIRLQRWKNKNQNSNPPNIASDPNTGVSNKVRKKQKAQRKNQMGSVLHARSPNSAADCDSDVEIIDVTPSIPCIDLDADEDEIICESNNNPNTVNTGSANVQAPQNDCYPTTVTDNTKNDLPQNDTVIRLPAQANVVSNMDNSKGESDIFVCDQSRSADKAFVASLDSISDGSKSVSALQNDDQQDSTAVTDNAGIGLTQEPNDSNISLPDWADVQNVSESADNSDLFFYDKSGSVDKPFAAPLYESISDGSFICDDSLIDNKQPQTSSINSEAVCQTNDVIDLDESGTDVEESAPEPSAKIALSNPLKRPASVDVDVDDSVIFVSETAPSFLPITSMERRLSKKQAAILKQNNIVANYVLKQRHKKSSKAKFQPPIHVPQQNVQRALCAVQPTMPIVQPIPEVAINNTYNPSKSNTETSTKRMVVIDGSNVAFAHSNNNTFSVRGLQICIEFFEQEGHTVKAVLPQMRLRHHMSSDPALLDQLMRQGKIVLTPCKNLPGRSSTSYDDRFILDVAAEFDAAIISNDNYRDLFMENESKYRSIIESRVIGYSWCMDLFMLPKDPYGRNGPTLSQILNRPACDIPSNI